MLKSPHIKATLSHLAHMHVFLNSGQNSSPVVHNFNRKHPSGESGSSKFRSHRVGFSDLNSKFELFNLDFFCGQCRPTGKGQCVSEGSCPFPGYKMGLRQPNHAWTVGFQTL